MSLETLETFDEVIKALADNPLVTGRKPSTVSMWRKAQGFPSNTYVAMTEALRKRGKTAPASLWGMKSPAESESA
jgi:hypothetical protein